MLDLRGHGHSEKPHDREHFGMDLFADDVRWGRHARSGRSYRLSCESPNSATS